MGRKKKQHRKGRGGYGGAQRGRQQRGQFQKGHQHPNEVNYEKTLKDNEMFEKFYQGLKLMPSEEWYYFYRRMQEPLPVTFRITGYRSHARQLLQILQTRFFDSLVGKTFTISNITRSPSNSGSSNNSRNSLATSPARDKSCDTAVQQAEEGAPADSGKDENQLTVPLNVVHKKEMGETVSSTVSPPGTGAGDGPLSETQTPGSEPVDTKAPLAAAGLVDAKAKNTSPRGARGFKVTKLAVSGWGDPPVTGTPGRDAVVIGTGLAGWDRGARRSASPKEPMKVEHVKPPKCLSWYPDELAWQIDLSRKVVRSQEVLSRLHDFLGNISRQEAVSMIPPLVLDVQPNSRVLDLCAAPGSKTAQLIEYLHKDENTIPEGFVVANDKDPKRCYLMVHQVKRLSSPCFMIVNQDASTFPRLRITPDEDKPEYLTFDRVLADVPCSGDGTMRKNIDIWRKWSPIMGVGMHSLQLKILKRGLELLEVGGRLVYSTCSMHPAEDEAVIAEMLRKCQGSVELVDISSYLPGLKTVAGLRSWKLMTKYGQWIESHDAVPAQLKTQFLKSMFPPTDAEAETFNLHRCVRILPHHQDTGGFFIAALQKVGHLPWSREARIEKEDEAKAQQAEAASLGAGTSANSGVPMNMSNTTANASHTTTDTDMEKHPGDPNAGTPMELSGASPAPGATGTAWGGPATVTIGDTRKRRAETEDGPQPKKRTKMSGYREDPFLFLQPDDPVWPPVKNFYGLGDDFPMNQLLYRCEQGPKRCLYFVSKAIRQIVQCNVDRVRFINMGVKTLSRSPSPIVPDCDFRLAQECMGSLSPFFTKRRVPIPKMDAVTILSQENPYFCKLTEGTQKLLEDMSPGSVMFQFSPTESETEPACNVTFCGWRGRASVRSFVPRFERQHCLRLFGEDLHKINAEVQLKKQQRLASQLQEALNSSAATAGPSTDSTVKPEDSTANQDSGNTTDTQAGTKPPAQEGQTMKQEQAAESNGDVAMPAVPSDDAAEQQVMVRIKVEKFDWFDEVYGSTT
ncbi:hypothetical protein BaRGS_00003413 [Batillaria attramentaria]|uniref:tRNA (cytosine(34)-C(5))-methyltransferase n=1 Tax=Batillaria attramentaria TaxID=370345 RepID=A0ABD0M189_9CAEN